MDCIGEMLYYIFLMFFIMMLDQFQFFIDEKLIEPFEDGCMSVLCGRKKEGLGSRQVIYLIKFIYFLQ